MADPFDEELTFNLSSRVESYRPDRLRILLDTHAEINQYPCGRCKLKILHAFSLVIGDS